MSARGRFALASVVGGVAALAVLAATLLQGHADLLAREPFGNFFDAQAQSLLHGHWDVPVSQVFIEGIERDGRIYEYFGVWPALLRMPVLAVSGDLAGRLTRVSMLGAGAIALTGFSLLHWRIRGLVRPDAGCSRREALVVGATVFCFGCGTALVFLTSRAWGYHEAILWGLAWALLGFERLVAYVVAPSRARLAAVTVLAALAFASRAPLGLGVVVGIGIVLGLRLLSWVRDRHDSTTSAREVAALVLAGVVPVGLYAAVNFARFGTLFSVPWTHQLVLNIDPESRAFLRWSGGTYFGAKFAPTTLLQYLRPDGLAPDGLFPWLTFPHYRTVLVGGVRFDGLDWSSSIPASMPAATVLAALGLVALVRRGTLRGRGATGLRIAFLGAAAGCLPVICVAFIAQRYLADFLVLVAIPALVGLQVLLRRAGDARRRRAAMLVLGVTAVLAVFGIWANLSLTILYQRLYNPSEPSTRAPMLAFQYDIDSHLPGHPHQLVRVTTLPHRVAGAGTTAIVGRCDSVYWSDGRTWIPIEGTPAGGWYRYRVHLSGGEPTPLLTWNDGATRLVVTRRPHHTELTLERSGAPPVTVTPRLADDTRFVLEVHADRGLRRVELRIDDDTVVDASGGSVPSGRPTAARGRRVAVEPLPPHLLVCPAVGAYR